MGHCITHNTYPATWTLKEITDDVCNTVRHSGDRYGTDKVRIPTETVFDTSEEAEAYIEKVDRHDYDGIAVKFLDFTGVEDSKKIKEYRAKIAELVKKKDEYIREHSVRKQKAAFIGCQSCGSKLNKEKLRGERCPLCNTDLRAASTLERIASFDTRVKETDKKITQERLKWKSKAKVRWLVKYEYHC